LISTVAVLNAFWKLPEIDVILLGAVIHALFITTKGLNSMLFDELCEFIM